MELEDADVLFTRALLRFDQSGGSADADNEATSDLGIEGARVAGLLDLENSLDPSDDFVGGGIRRLIDVEHTGFDVVLDFSLEKRVRKEFLLEIFTLRGLQPCG